MGFRMYKACILMVLVLLALHADCKPNKKKHVKGSVRSSVRTTGDDSIYPVASRIVKISDDTEPLSKDKTENQWKAEQGVEGDQYNLQDYNHGDDRTGHYTTCAEKNTNKCHTQLTRRTENTDSTSNRKIIYAFDMEDNKPPIYEDKIRNVMEYLNRQTGGCVSNRKHRDFRGTQFRYYQDLEFNDVLIKFKYREEGPCFHQWENQERTKIEISISGDCMTEGEILHQVMHALGYYHEEQRQDRDNYVSIDCKNVTGYLTKKLFGKIDPYETHIFAIPFKNIRYDYNSIMHSPNNAFKKNLQVNDMITIKVNKEHWTSEHPISEDGIHMGQRLGLSEMDIKRLKCNFCNMDNDSQREECGDVVLPKNEDLNGGFDSSFDGGSDGGFGEVPDVGFGDGFNGSWDDDGSKYSKKKKSKSNK